jgi:hypothetical protein
MIFFSNLFSEFLVIDKYYKNAGHNSRRYGHDAENDPREHCESNQQRSN